VLVKGTLISGTSDLLKTITSCSVILHACSQLKFHLDIFRVSGACKGGCFSPVQTFFKFFL
jgi:hypothetical protein